MFSPAGDVAGALPSSASKGKARMDEEDEAVSVPCGICFTDSGRAIPGELDCCSHHFCFVCIMAWARVESRCPFCKARFHTIRRPPVPGRFLSERLVTVAERNQVYHPGGNGSSTAHTDPYVNTSCSVCNCSRDEELLLLCELCDAAAHTYCVGLGTTVPEEDWFCRDCMTSKEEHVKCQIDDGGSSGQREYEISIEVPRDEPVADPSIFYIADEDRSLSSVQRTYEQSSGPFLVDPVPSIYDIVDEDYATNPVCRNDVRSTRPDRKAGDYSLQSASDGPGCDECPQQRASGHSLLHARALFGVDKARTLRNSRNISNHIVALRENWAALRAGSRGFATHQLNSGRQNGTGTVSAIAEHHLCATAMVSSSKNGVATSGKEQQQFAVPLTKEEITSISVHANKMLPEDTHHVRKAWKMLEIAKSTGGRMKCNKPKSLNFTPPFSMGNRSSSYSPIDTIVGQKDQICNEAIKRNTAKHDCGAKKGNTMSTKNSEKSTKNSEKHLNLPETNRVLVHERMVSSRERMVNQESLNGKVASSSNIRHVDQTSESVSGAAGSGKSKSDVLHPLTCGLSSGQFIGPSGGSQSTMIVNPEEASVVSDATSNKFGAAGATVEVTKDSGPDCHGRRRKLCFGTSDDRGSKKSRASCKIAKTEISSLAIRELKLLKIDKTYGSDKFKEVARAATHTVLAYYGLEHLPSASLTLPKPICKHSCKMEPLKLSAITNTCRDCLRDFVKQVTYSVLTGKQMDPTATSC